MPSPTQSQFDFNATSRDAWQAFAEHRSKVTRLLLDALPTPGAARLCVLGAGNVNDLNLMELMQTFDQIHLVDLDAQALAGGLARQQLAGSPQIFLHGGLDVTAQFKQIENWSSKADLSDAELAACVDLPAQQLSATLPGPFDVVTSTCLLSQLMLCVREAIGEAHPRFVDAIQAVRLGHLRLLAHLTRPGGRLLLFTDIVSSESSSELATVPDAQLPLLLRRLIGERNFFHGMNPAVIGSLFSTDPVLKAQLTDIAITAPWRWNLGQRTYAVCAFLAKRHQV